MLDFKKGVVMNKNVFVFTFFAMTGVFCLADMTRTVYQASGSLKIQYNELTFKNNSNVIIEATMGTEEDPAHTLPFPAILAKEIKPGQEAILQAALNDRKPSVMFWEKGKKEIAYVYEFNTTSKKRLAVQLTKDMKLRSVPLTYNTIDNSEIVSKGVVDLKSHQIKFYKDMGMELPRPFDIKRYLPGS